jgi:hypothetical protein
LAQEKEYERAKRRRLNPTEPEGGAAQAGLVQRVQDRAAFPQPTEVLNDNDAAIFPVETETERAYREEFLNELRQQTRYNRRTIRTHRKAQEPVLFEANIPTHDCGRMDVKCGDCNALHFKKEMSSDKKFSNCCNKGKVSLPELKESPKLLESLLTNSRPQANNFMKKKRNYNSALDFASMGANVSLPPGRGPYCFRIHGMVYHSTRSVGQDSLNPAYAGLYFMDSAQVTDLRLHNQANAGCELWLMVLLDNILREVNPYAHLYKSMRQVFEEEQQKTVSENREQTMIIHVA